MPRLPSYKTKKVVNKLESLGFVFVRQRGSHAFYRNLQTGKTTVVPIHAKEIGRGLLRKIINDCDISVEDFVNA